MIIRKAYTGADGITRIAELSELDIAELRAEFKKQLNKNKEELMDDFTRDKLTLSFEFYLNQALENKIAKDVKTIEKKTKKSDTIRNCPICGLIIAKNYRRHDLGLEWWCKKGHFSVRALNKGEEHILCKFCNEKLMEDSNPKDKTKPFWCFMCREWKNRQGED